MTTAPLRRRIAVIGAAGSGKTYLARELARRLGLCYVDFDGLLVLPHWGRVPRVDRPELYAHAYAGDSWVTDGHLQLDHRPEERVIFDRTDTVVWLDFPLWYVMASVTRRTLLNTLLRRPTWGGNVEGWDRLLTADGSIRTARRQHARFKRWYGAMFLAGCTANDGQRYVRLRSRAEVNHWLERIAP